MNTQLLGKAELDGGNGTQIKLEYYLVEENRTLEDDTFLYGIEVKKESRSKTGIFREHEIAPCLSYSKKDVEHLIQVLLEHTVTPINLLEIIDDYITKEGFSA